MVFPSRLIRPNERENRKLRARAKTARLKATVRELLGFLHRKAPLAAQTVGRGGAEGLIASTRFPYAKSLYGGRYEISEGPITARREGPRRVEFPALIRHYAIFKSVPWNFFSLTRFCPVPLLLPPPTPRAQPLVPLSMREFRARSIIENCGMRWSVCHFLFIVMIISSLTVRLSYARQSARLQRVSIGTIIFETYVYYYS